MPEYNEYTSRTSNDVQSRERRGGYAEWIALGAVVAGTIGAVVGAARCMGSARDDSGPVGRPDSATVTAPHGDKLSSALSS